MELSSDVDFLTLLLLEAEGTCRNCLVILELPIGFDALVSRTLEGIPSVLFDKFFQRHFWGICDYDRKVVIPMLIRERYQDRLYVSS
jgi:hypothetical protein